MWFKQIQLFQLRDSLTNFTNNLSEKLEAFTFKPCLPSMMMSFGWVNPIEGDETKLFQNINGKIMLCFQFEEKILPAIVIRQELAKKIKEIETIDNRKMGSAAKLALKDQIITTLLPRAFTKITKIYGYVDTHNNWLVIGSSQEKQVNLFLSLFKKSISENLNPYEFKNLSATFTEWLTKQNYPTEFSIEKACLLQDPNQQKSMLRCQQQNLFSKGIRSFIDEGLKVKQLALSWHDHLEFVLSENFTISSIKFSDDITVQVKDMEAETPLQVFNADFFIMGETFNKFLNDLLKIFFDNKIDVKKISEVLT